MTDEGLVFVLYYDDNDSDTYGAGGPISSCSVVSGKVINNTDCNDNNAAINPGATEIAGDNVDSKLQWSRIMLHRCR